MNNSKLFKDTTLIPLKALSETTLDNSLHPLSGKLKAFLQSQENTTGFISTGLKKDDYLKVIEAQVRAMLKYQNKEGRLIDPVEKTEKYYSTPCFAHAVSALVASGAIEKDNPLAISGMKALDASLTDMVNATVNGNHGDFYTWPVMLAYRLFKTNASKEQVNSWDEKLKSINIEKLYAFYNQEKNLNWILVHASGEYLRAKEGFTTVDYAERMIKYQLSNFTDLGMYDEPGNPLAYDLFARHYLAGMLQLDYKGQHYSILKHNLWKGAWTSLFVQSPFGELPTGYRSSHHIWNEAEQSVLFEIYASAYAKAGLNKEAGAFKRAAMLSLSSIQNWIREDGSGYIVKNRFPIEKKHGYERYSVHTCYNMLAMSMLAQAWQFSNGAIEEYPAPADIGGAVVTAVKPFHKIFASLKGNYVEYDTSGDQKYNPTGILRVHLQDGHPQLGPSEGIAELYSGEGNVMALGPSWKDDEGNWIYLAKFKDLEPEIKIVTESDSEVTFSVSYNFEKVDNNNLKQIVETISITDKNVTITNEFKGFEGIKRLVWPMLINDGREKTAIKQTDNSVSLYLEGKGVKWSTNFSKNINLILSNEQFEHRNGISSPMFVEFKENKITYTLEAVK
ncbi:hypothetical protein FUA26_13560 [Seonamhaeicola algicola]|uniref:Uncharacterized protein n=1 Tax=Seonamhaeicola algicola TaxID=1719036 RepID=A0A5C7AID7_9FLAO|nr:hypothetical protein [Seonamhaeicola algicola]TXE07243.1 hypothetical protein FUA26_13560 [Seonamhaeicola algicola]